MSQPIVIDTNVILHDPYIVKKLTNIAIPSTVLQELDSFKKSNNELAKNVREFARILDQHPELNVFFLPSEEFEGDNDQKIISLAKHIKATLLTNDLLMLFRARAQGVECERYVPEKRQENNESFSGISSIEEIDELGDLYANEFLNHNSGKIERWDGSQLNSVSKDRVIFGLKSKNLEQKCAMELLLDDNVKLVTLSGVAGTGKTLLAIAAALESTIVKNSYAKILVGRAIVPMGNDIGYLPGDMKEKLAPWIQPIVDNLDFLFNTNKKQQSSFSELEGQGIIEVQALTHIRGRSISNQYMIIDEAQNLSIHEIKTILTRAGEGTKIILTGDPDQIDNPKLDSINNGLSYVIEKFKDQKIAGHITLTKSERSELAAISAEIL